MSETLSLQETNEIVVNKLQNVRSAISKLYAEHPDAHMIALSIDSTLNKLTNQVGFAVGVQQNPDTLKAAAKQQFEPVSMFMGEPISFKSALNVDDITVDRSEIEVFREKVDSLYMTIEAIPSEKVVTQYAGSAEMETVLRGVAKKAGMQNYDSEAITVGYVEMVKKAIDDKNKESLMQQNAEAQLQQSIQYQSTAPKEDEITLTDTHLNAFPHLVAAGLKAGDIVKKDALQPASQITEDGKLGKESLPDAENSSKESLLKTENSSKESLPADSKESLPPQTQNADSKPIKGSPNPDVTANSQGQRIATPLKGGNSSKSK
jgi:hypothetical protein